MSYIKNEEQEKAIQCIHGPSILVSCPGSGKTTTLLRRIEHMLQSGIASEHILMVTFTKAAAEEMEKKFKKNFVPDSKVTFSTIHSLCLRILIYYAGYSAKDILKDSDTRYKLTVLARKYSDTPEMAVRSFHTYYSACRNSRTPLENAEPEGLPKNAFLAMAKEYESIKKSLRKIDFDDMMILALSMLESRSDILQFLQNTWTHIQVDEYQDVNQLQKDILYLLAGKYRNLCVAGDDDQSIYRFRGADPQIMLDFKKDFPDAQEFFISTNYRSFPKIIDTADHLISHNKVRFDKKFLSSRQGDANVEICENDDDFTLALCQNLKKQENYKNTAILYRKNAQAEIVAAALQSEGIPFYSNERISNSYDSWVWGDICAYIRLSEEFNEADFGRILNKPQRYLKTKESTFEGVRAALPSMFDEDWKVEKAEERLDGLKQHLRIIKDLPMKDKITYVLKGVGYEGFIREYCSYCNMDYDTSYGNSFRVFASDAKKVNSLQEWEKLIERKRITLQKTNKDGVCLSTMHRSKGLEWENVHIIEVDEGIVPLGKNLSSADMEEERRLFYVAITRSKENLWIYCNKHKKSPFLKELRELSALDDPRDIKRSLYKGGAIPDWNTVKENDMVRLPHYGFGIVREVLPDKVCVVFGMDNIKFFKKNQQNEP